MGITVELAPEVYRILQSVAQERHQTVNEVLEATVRDRYQSSGLPTAIVTQDEQGFPQIDIGRPITLEEVRAAVEEE